MSLIVIVIIVQAASSTLAWLGFYVGIRALPGARALLQVMNLIGDHYDQAKDYRYWRDR